MDIKFDSNGLVPVITCDAVSGEVLMQAFMNKEALELTIKTKRAHYYSRSRQSLWLKGETSGHFQEVTELCSDCDNDCILLKVLQTGNACHTGARSCFFNNRQVFKQIDDDSSDIFLAIENRINERERTPIEGSYTNYLLDKGVEKISKKVGEEASEVIIAAMKNDSDELANELADLYYHTLVLMKKQNLSFLDVVNVLKERHNSERKRNY